MQALREPKHTSLLRVVDQRRGADQPVAAARRAPGRDAVTVRVARDHCDDARIGVEYRERGIASLRGGEGAVREHDDAVAAGS